MAASWCMISAAHANTTQHPRCLAPQHVTSAYEQEMEEQLISRLLEEGTVKSDAGRGAHRLRQSLEAVRKAEAAIDKLKRSLSRQQVGCLTLCMSSDVAHCLVDHGLEAEIA